MNPAPDTFEKRVLLGWPLPPAGKSEFDEAAAHLWSPEPGISMQAVYSMEAPGGYPAPERIGRVADWSAVARVDPAGRDVSWMNTEKQQPDVLAGAIIAWDRARPTFEMDLVRHDLTLFLDGYASARHPSWEGCEGPGCIVLDDTISRLLMDAGERPRPVVADITVDGRYFARYAGTLATAGLALGVLADYMASNAMPERIRILVPCDHSLLLSAARTRAIRVLAARVAGAFSFPLDRLEIWGLVEPECRCPDRSTHQIHVSVGAVAAVLGTCDRVVVEPFAESDPPDADSLRLALNVLRILKFESRLGTPEDALRGAHYVEALTRQIVDGGWDLFLNMEDAGGIVQVAEEFSIPKFLEDHRRRGSGHAET